MSRYRSIMLLLVLLVLNVLESQSAPASADEVELSGSEGLMAYVSKKGAKIRVYRDLDGNNNGHGFGQTGTIEVFLDAIEELDGELDKLSGNHKISSFSNQDFTVNFVENVSLPLSVSSDVYADCLNCSSTLEGKVGGGTKISIAVCAINANGTLTMNGEDTEVTEGQLKITFSMVDWPFSSGAENLAVDIVIKIPPGREISHDNSSESDGKKPKKFSLGADSMIEFSEMVYEDNAWYEMPDGYPEYIPRGANNQFRLIFKKFDSTAIYDPNLEVGYEPYGASDARSIKAAPSAVVGVIAALVLQRLL